MSARDCSELRVFDAIFRLRATRVYEDRPLAPESIARILEAAPLACSSGGTQPWAVLVVTARVVTRARKAIVVEAFSHVDRERAQVAEELVDDSGRPVTGHAAIDNIDVVAALVCVFWNPDRGIRMKGEYAENPDGTLRPTRHIPGGRGSSVYSAC